MRGKTREEEERGSRKKRQEKDGGQEEKKGIGRRETRKNGEWERGWRQ